MSSDIEFHTTGILWEYVATLATAEYISRGADRSTGESVAMASVSDLRAQVLVYLMFALPPLRPADSKQQSIHWEVQIVAERRKR